MGDKSKVNESLLAIVLLSILGYYFTNKEVLLTIGFIVGIVGLASSKLGLLIHQFWSKLIGIVGKINTTILLSLIFWLVLTPVALLMRLFKKTPVVLRKPENTNFITRSHLFTKSDLNNPW